MNVSELHPGMKKVDLIVKVVKKNETRTVRGRNDGREHRVADLLVGDETGVVSLSLWNEMIAQIQEDEVIHITNGYTTEFGGKMQLNIGRYGGYEKLNPNEYDFDVYLEEIAQTPNLPAQYIQVVNTLRKERGINVRVKVIDQLPSRSVTTKKDGKRHSINTWLVGDETAVINFVLWDKGDEITVGDVYDIEGGYTREFNNILELNLSQAGSYNKSSEKILEVNTDRNISKPSS